MLSAAACEINRTPRSDPDGWISRVGLA